MPDPPTLSLPAALSILCATGVGIGVLIMPKAMAAMGIVPMFWTLLLGGVVSGFTTFVLFLCGRRGMQCVRKPSFDDVVDAVKFPDGASYGEILVLASSPKMAALLDLIMLYYSIGAYVAWFIFLTQLLRAFEWFPSDTVSSSMTTCIIAVVTIPAVIQPSIGFFGKLAFLSPLSMLSLLCGIFYRLPERLETNMEPSYWYAGDYSTAPAAICVTVFAVFWHTTCVSVVRELEDPTRARCGILAFGGAGVVAVFYFVVALGGYLSFGDAVGVNIITMYGTDPIFVVCNAILFASLLVTVSVSIYPCRESVCGLLCFAFHGFEMTKFAGGVVGVFVVTVSAFIAIICPSAAKVIALLGGSSATMLMVVFPAIMTYLVMSKTTSRLFALLSLPIGIWLNLAAYGVIGQPMSDN